MPPRPPRKSATGAESRDLLFPEEYPSATAMQIAALRRAQGFQGGGRGLYGGGDPNFGTPPPSPFLVNVAPLSTWNGDAWVLGLDITTAYTLPTPDTLRYLEYKVTGDNGFYWTRQFTDYDPTRIISDFGLVFDATYSVEARAVLASAGATPWSDAFTGIYFSPDPLHPPAPAWVGSGFPAQGVDSRGAWQNVDWAAVTGFQIRGYRVGYRPTGGTWQYLDVVDGATIARVVALTPDTPYEYMIGTLPINGAPPVWNPDVRTKDSTAETVPTPANFHLLKVVLNPRTPGLADVRLGIDAPLNAPDHYEMVYFVPPRGPESIRLYDATAVEFVVPAQRIGSTVEFHLLAVSAFGNASNPAVLTEPITIPGAITRPVSFEADDPNDLGGLLGWFRTAASTSGSDASREAVTLYTGAWRARFALTATSILDYETLPLVCTAGSYVVLGLAAIGSHSSSLTGRAFLDWYSDGAGTVLISTTTVLNIAVTTSQTLIDAQYLAPANTVTVRLRLGGGYSGGSTGRYVAWNLWKYDTAAKATDIAPGAVTTPAFAAGAVDTAALGAGAVTSTKIGAGAVDTAALGTGAVTSTKIGAGAVDTAALGAGAVTSAKIGAGAVDTAALGAGAVTSAKIGAGAVNTAALLAGAVTVPKLNLLTDAASYAAVKDLSGADAIGLWAPSAGADGLGRIQGKLRGGFNTGMQYGDTYGNTILQSSTGTFITSIGELRFTGALAPTFAAKSSTFTADALTSAYQCTNTITANLPTAVGCGSRIYVIANVGTGVVTVDPNGTQTVGGRTTWVLGRDSSIIIQSDNVNWQVLGGHNQNAGAAFPTTGLYSGLVYYRTDLHRWGSYDGTRWLSEEYAFPLTDYTAGAQPWFTGGEKVNSAIPGDNGLYLYGWQISFYGDIDSSNYWVIQLRSLNASIGFDYHATISTQFEPSGSWLSPTMIKAFLSNPIVAGGRWLQIFTYAVGSPGIHYVIPYLRIAEVLT